MSAIAERTGHVRKTVRKVIVRGLIVPKYASRTPRPTLLGPYEILYDGMKAAVLDEAADDTGIVYNGPVRRNRAQTARTVMKPGPALAPVLATHDQIEFPSEQRMVWTRHPKRSTVNVTVRRS